jgi:hypothetical protein
VDSEGKPGTCTLNILVVDWLSTKPCVACCFSTVSRRPRLLGRGGPIFRSNRLSTNVVTGNSTDTKPEMEYHLLLARGMNGAGLGTGGVNWSEALIFHEKIQVLGGYDDYIHE